MKPIQLLYIHTIPINSKIVFIVVVIMDVFAVIDSLLWNKFYPKPTPTINPSKSHKGKNVIIMEYGLKKKNHIFYNVAVSRYYTSAHCAMTKNE